MIRLFKVSFPSSAVALIISEAVLVFSCYLLAAFIDHSVPMVVFLFEQGGYWHIGFVTAVIIIGLYFNDLYEQYRVRSRIQLVQQFCLVLGIAFLLQSLVAYANWGVLLPKWVMVYGSMFVLVVLPVWRVFFTAQLLSAGGQKVLFLGLSPATREIATLLAEQPEIGLAPIGYLGDPADELGSTPRLGSIAALDEIIEERHPARIVVAETQSVPVDRLLELRLAGVHIEDASATYEAVFRRISTRDLPPSRLIFSNQMSPSVGNVTLQSAYSLLLGLIGLVLALPVMAIVALILKFTSTGPVLCRERCAGLNGATFSVYKFMPAAAAAWLKKYRLEDLPQLFNVVRGEMAIVGPRPEKPEFMAVLEEKIPYYRQRLSVKPGMTGWAQIQERGGQIEDSIVKLEYDRYYIKNLSLSLDTYIIFHTFKITLGGR